MTILIAAKATNGQGIHLLSDSLGTDNLSKYNSGNKWTHFEHFSVAAAGDINVKTLLREYMFDDLNVLKIESKRDVIELHKLIDLKMIEVFGTKKVENEDRDYIDFVLLVATKSGKIFSDGVFLNVDEEDCFGTQGSGKFHAQGALAFMYANNMVSKANLMQVMEQVTLYKYNCGGPMHYLFLPITNNEQA